MHVSIYLACVVMLWTDISLVLGACYWRKLNQIFLSRVWHVDVISWRRIYFDKGFLTAPVQIFKSCFFSANKECWFYLDWLQLPQFFQFLHSICFTGLNWISCSTLGPARSLAEALSQTFEPFWFKKKQRHEWNECYLKISGSLRLSLSKAICVFQTLFKALSS